MGEGLLGRGRKGTLQHGEGWGLEPPDCSVMGTSMWPGCSEAERHGPAWRAGGHGPLSAGLVLRERGTQGSSSGSWAASGGAGPSEGPRAGLGGAGVSKAFDTLPVG